jgi:hypothetical protein
VQARCNGAGWESSAAPPLSPVPGGLILRLAEDTVPHERPD